MNHMSNFSNGSTLLEVAMPTQLSGASPTTYFCGNMIWRQFIQGAKNAEQIRKQVATNNISTSRPQSSASTFVQSQQYSQLHVSACLGQVKSTNALLEGCSQSELNKQDHNGNTPLIWAAAEGNEEVVQLLVDSRANVNAQNFAGETALFLAASRGFVGICSLLLENGANPNITNIEGETPLHMASASGNNNVISLLVSRGAFVNAQDDAGDCPLHYAIREEKFSSVEMLVTRCNASVDIMNDDQETPLQLASCLDCTEMVQFLSKFAMGSENKHEGSSNAMFMVQGNFGW